MKKLAFFFMSMLLFCAACSDDDDDAYKTYTLGVQLEYPSDSEVTVSAGVTVTLTSSTGVTYESTTDDTGLASFTVSAGIYTASASEQQAIDGYAYSLNGTTTGITVTTEWVDGTVVSLSLTQSVSGQVIIKELYIGGTPKDDGSGYYQYDKYAIIYNNSDQTATISNFCLGMVNPYNGHASINDYVDGVLYYADLGYIPAGVAIWYLGIDMVLEPAEQAVIALCGAIDHTTTYSYSVDLSEADYCTYDIEDFSSTSYYPTPSEKISTDHYFEAYKYGQGTAWPLSVSSPAFYIFSTGDTDPVEFASTDDYHYTVNGKQTAVYCCAKVPNEWILDGIEVFSSANLEKSYKRLTDDIDAGYISFTNQLGYSCYRNVDQEATEALEENEGLLVYGYSYGTDDSTDPSGIDAEASLAAGARIIYQDTNNSTNDFHQRSQASLRD